MNIYHDIDSSRITPEIFIAVIEIEKNGKNKYELDKQTGLLIMDRVLYTSTHYPANYGFIPLTYSEDDDPLDVFVYCSHPIQPLSLVKCYPIGAVDMIDGDKKDTKILAVPFGDPEYNLYKEINELPPHMVDELMHFLKVYKELENKTTTIGDFHDAKYAKEQIVIARECYRKKFKK